MRCARTADPRPRPHAHPRTVPVWVLLQCLKVPSADPWPYASHPEAASSDRPGTALYLHRGEASVDARPARGFLGPPADSCRAEMLPFAGLDSGARRTSRSEETPDSAAGSQGARNRVRSNYDSEVRWVGAELPGEGVERWSESEGAIVSRGWGTGAAGSSAMEVRQGVRRVRAARSVPLGLTDARKRNTLGVDRCSAPKGPCSGEVAGGYVPALSVLTFATNARSLRNASRLEAIYGLRQYRCVARVKTNLRPMKQDGSAPRARHNAAVPLGWT